MTSFPSVGDQSRSYQMRLSQYLLKTKLDRLSKEVATGIKSDIPQALNGDLSRISHIETRMKMLAAYQQNASEAASMFEAMQITLDRIQTTVDDIGPNLLNDAGGSPDDVLSLRAAEVSGEFRSIFRALNTASSGRHVFSGTKTDTAPLAAFDDMIVELNSVVGGATAASDIIAQIETWFDAPAGSGGFTDTIYQGSGASSNGLSVSSDRVVNSDLTANSEGLRRTLKGMAIITYVAEFGSGLSSTMTRELFTASGLLLVDATVDLANARAEIGWQEAAVSKAQVRNTAETTSLTIARSTLIAADPYETATALQETEAGIQNLYTLTARLSRLSLTDYLS